MCSFNQAVAVKMQGSGRDNRGWFDLGKAQVYHDHFIEAPIEAGVVIDFLKPAPVDGKLLQATFELSAESARQLAQAIQATLAGMPSEPEHAAAQAAITVPAAR